MDETELGELYAKELLKIILAGNTVGRRISDISEDLCDQLTDHLKTSRFALRVAELIHVMYIYHLCSLCVGKWYKGSYFVNLLLVELHHCKY